jgi:small subunit ribosomal protein S17
MTDQKTPSTDRNTQTATHRRFAGVVTSKKTDKTIVVSVNRTLRHKLYGKRFARSRKFQVHDERNQYQVGDTVEFVECRPISKHKKWRVLYAGETSQA